MGWLSDIIAGRENAAFYRDQFTKSEQARAGMVLALQAEIDRNRNREVRLMEAMLRQQNIAPAGLADRMLPDDDDNNADIDITDIDGDTPEEAKQKAAARESDVEQRAQDFIRAAEERGTPYTDENIEQLYKELRSNPELLEQ